jgi:SAM-dependent methyltransferase
VAADGLGLGAAPGGALIGDEGRLISTDFSPKMVEVARRRGDELGLSNVEYRVMDAEHIELEDGAVDGVICRYGFMLMADPAAALAETRRVLRPRGRLVLAVWRSRDQNPWVSIAGRVLVERGHMTPPEPGAPGQFTMANDEQVTSLLERAAFEDVPVLLVYRGTDDYVAFASDTCGSFAAAFRDAPEEERTAIKREIEAAFAPYAADGNYEPPASRS